MSINVRHFGQAVGATTVTDMAKRLGLESRPLFVRDMIKNFGLPVQPNLTISWLEGSFPQHPVGHAPNSGNVPVIIQGGVTLDFGDPGKGSQRAANRWTLHLRTGNGEDKISAWSFPSVGFQFNFDTAYTWSVVPENEYGIGPSSPVFIFHTEMPPAPKPGPPPTPTPVPPPNLVGISKLSLYNCQIERHTVYVWVRDVTGNGPWGLIQVIPTQYNASGQCPYDDNGIVAGSTAILTKKGETGGFHCTNGNVYQVSIVDPERPTCEGRNDPTVGNCVVEDQPSFFKFSLEGDEITVMLENGRFSPVPPGVG